MTISRLLLADEIRNRLRDQILTGKLQPGQRLTEQGVAREMGTSQGPVREAFSDLCREGLLISLPHRGTFVSQVSEEEARTAYQVRALLEPWVMEQAMAKITPEVVQTLKEAILQMRAAADQNDFPSTMAADLAFHGQLYELAGGPLLAKIWSTLEATIMKFAVIAAPRYYRDYGHPIHDHEEIVRLLESRDTAALRELDSTHLIDLWKRIDAAKDGSHRHRP